ncbi:hypothetical protein EVAR_11810_1 [Eumeta japonica]|uniref:Uncharacterized protein n=1 Tax=Eumeta variegata TaxID=151549 RepID=A0A4C1UQN5_EUMVA|nr:hypothetical protein EVAR_11810_1 [Eumeta japonica]
MKYGVNVRHRLPVFLLSAQFVKLKAFRPSGDGAAAVYTRFRSRSCPRFCSLILALPLSVRFRCRSGSDLDEAGEKVNSLAGKGFGGRRAGVRHTPASPDVRKHGKHFKRAGPPAPRGLSIVSYTDLFRWLTESKQTLELT